MSENLKKYNQAFKTTFSIDDDLLNDELAYQNIASWDSVGHMTLIANLEEAFGIMMEIEDIVDFNSYKKGLELVRKYGVNL